MLSERLLQIAGMVEKDKVVFDVGSDHALLPCFLVREGICPRAYAGEIAQGPLEKSRQTIEKYHLEDRVIPVFSDGLVNASDDVSVVVIAGMGYHTIRHILDTCDMSRYEYFIVQSNNDVDLLRQYLSDHNYTIEDEKVVYDGFYYQIIRFSADHHDHYTDMEIRYGPVLLRERDETFISYLKDRLTRLTKINARAHRDDYADRIKEIEKILYN